MKTLNVRLVIVTRLDKMALIDYLINKKCVYQHHVSWNFRLRHFEREFWLVQTNLRQEKSVFSFLSECVNHSISQVLWYLFQTIILECLNTKFHNLQHQKAFTSSWNQSREACVESLLVFEDQPRHTVCHKLEASHLWSLELVDCNDQKCIECYTN